MNRTFPPLIALAALLAVPAGCGESSRGGPSLGNDSQARQVGELAANAHYSVADAAKEPLLAFELRITPQAVEVVDARFMRAPLPRGQAEQDLIVIGMSGARIAHKYGFADPLDAQVEERDRGLHGSMRLPEARVWVYMPAVALDRVEISPARDDAKLPRGGRIDVAAVLRRLCAGAPVDACAQRALSAAAANPATTPPPTSPPPPPPPPPAPQ